MKKHNFLFCYSACYTFFISIRSVHATNRFFPFGTLLTSSCVHKFTMQKCVLGLQLHDNYKWMKYMHYHRNFYVFYEASMNNCGAIVMFWNIHNVIMHWQKLYMTWFVWSKKTCKEELSNEFDTWNGHNFGKNIFSNYALM